MPCYINLPLRWAYEQPAWADWFVNGRIAPELGLDAGALALPNSWHKTMAARFADAGLSCSVHLPFWNVDPCDSDAGKAAQARDSLRRGAELAALYGVRHMVGHPYYQIEHRERDLSPWLEASCRIWPELPRISGASLFLENTYEQSPDAIAALVLSLQEEAAGGPDIGVCFDVGHWHSFGGKKTAEELEPWLDAFCPFALHLHLHDNDGSSDQHLGMGEGGIPYDALWRKFDARNKAVTATLEPHDTKSFAASMRWLATHNAVADRLGWIAPQMEALPLTEIEKNIAKT